MKQLEATVKTINGNTYYIFPFPAFKAANMSGKLMALLTPAIGALTTIAGKDKGVMDLEVENAIPVLTSALGNVDGDKIEDLLKNLLLAGNVNVDYGNRTVRLNEDIANELFCGETQDMFVLAAEVIKVNYSGFFTKASNLFGTQRELSEKMGIMKNMVNSTPVNSAN